MHYKKGASLYVRGILCRSSEPQIFLPLSLLHVDLSDLLLLLQHSLLSATTQRRIMGPNSQIHFSNGHAHYRYVYIGHVSYVSGESNEFFIDFSGLDASWLQVYIFFWSVHFAALLLTTVLLAYHVNLIFRGRTTYENNNSINLYNLGWRQNLMEVFGKNWKKAIIWPMAPSALPHNGVDWDTTESWRMEGPKNR